MGYGKVEDRGRIGDDDQTPGSLFARCKSCSMASTLKVELWKAREKRGLAKSQAFPLEQRQREFCLQLGLGQLG